MHALANAEIYFPQIRVEDSRRPVAVVVATSSTRWVILEVEWWR